LINHKEEDDSNNSNNEDNELKEFTIKENSTKNRSRSNKLKSIRQQEAITAQIEILQQLRHYLVLYSHLWEISSISF